MAAVSCLFGAVLAAQRLARIWLAPLEGDDCVVLRTRMRGEGSPAGFRVKSNEAKERLDSSVKEVRQLSKARRKFLRSCVGSFLSVIFIALRRQDRKENFACSSSLAPLAPLRESQFFVSKKVISRDFKYHPVSE
jgi:hypothetical protein